MNPSTHFHRLISSSILLTSFCVKYPPDLIACFCIHLAAAWLKIEVDIDLFQLIVVLNEHIHLDSIASDYRQWIGYDRK